jgi:hypothetical protein
MMKTPHPTAMRRLESRRGDENGSQREQAGTFADRRCGRARETDRQGHRHIRDGRRDSEGGEIPLRPGDQYPRRHQSKTGEIKLQRLLEVSETVEDSATQISIEQARDRNPDAQPGDFIAEQLPPLDFGRIAAQSAKQVIVQKVREAERDNQYEEFKDRVGEIVNGTVKRVEYGNVIVDLGRAEAIIRRDELIPRETVRYGDRVRAYVYDVRREQRGPQIFLSRTHPQFMAKLFPWKCRKSTTASSRSSRSPAIPAPAPRSP